MGHARAAAGNRRKVEDLLHEAEIHIVCREHTTSSLARALGVSVPTMARLVVRLRQLIGSRGGELVSIRKGRVWHYEIREQEQWLSKVWSTDPLLKAVGALRGPKRPLGETVDDIIYDGR